jgi:hypothetical protein
VKETTAMEELVGIEVQARAVQQLRDRGDPAVADLLASCVLHISTEDNGEVRLELVGPLARAAGPLDLGVPVGATLAQALREALPPGTWIERLVARPADGSAEVVPPDRPAAPARPRGVNQAVGELAPRVWAGMRFRSESELRIAQALDRAGAMVLPGCLARLGPSGARQTREPDFLVCWQGVWGILEVDGEPFHPAARSSANEDRDRLFVGQGIRVVAHYEASRCFAAPDAVVAEFLAALGR